MSNAGTGSEMSEAGRKLFDDAVEGGEKTDMEFLLDCGRRIRGHTLWLMARCDYIRGMLSSGMKEEKTRIVRVRECSVGGFLVLLEYLYTAVLRGDACRGQDWLELWRISQLFMVQSMVDKLSHFVTLRNFTDFLRVAIESNDDSLLKVCESTSKSMFETSFLPTWPHRAFIYGKADTNLSYLRDFLTTLFRAHEILSEIHGALRHQVSPPMYSMCSSLDELLIARIDYCMAHIGEIEQLSDDSVYEFPDGSKEEARLVYVKMMVECFTSDVGARLDMFGHLLVKLGEMRLTGVAIDLVQDAGISCIPQWMKGLLEPYAGKDLDAITGLGSENDRVQKGISESLRGLMMICFSRHSVENGVHSRIIHAGGVAIISQAMHLLRYDEDIQNLGCHLFSAIATNCLQSDIERIGIEGGLQAIVGGMIAHKDEFNLELTTEGCCAIFHLVLRSSQDCANRRLAVEAGAIKAILAALKAQPEPQGNWENERFCSLQEAGVSAIWEILKRDGDNYDSLFIQEGGIEIFNRTARLVRGMDEDEYGEIYNMTIMTVKRLGFGVDDQGVSAPQAAV